MRPLLVAGCLALIVGCYDARHQGMVDVSGTGDVVDAVVEPTKHEFSTSCIATLPGTITRSPALAIDGDVVVLLDADADQGPRLAKLSLDGELRWLLTLGEPGDVAASPPVVRQSGEILVTISGPDAGFLLRVDSATGTRLGTIPLGQGPHFAPAPLPPGPILITSGKTLRAFSREGVELWVREYSEPVSSAVVVGSSKRVAEITPDPAWAERYDRMMPIYERLYRGAQAFYADLDALAC